MAVPGGTFETYQTVGIREDLTDVISLISPTKRPFMSNIERASAMQTMHEFQTDELDPASPDNAAAEGDDTASDTATPTKRYANFTQIVKKIARVSGTNRAVDAAGRADELDYQVYKRLEEVGRDIETAMSSGNGAAAGSSGSGRKMAGAGRWTWNEVNATGATGGAATTDPGAGAPTGDLADATGAGVIDEDNLKAAIKLCWDDGGEPDMVLANGTNKQQISEFTGIATRYREVANEPAAIIGAADLYVSDFGTHYIVASHFMPTATLASFVLVLDTEQWKSCYLRPVGRENLAKTGDSDRVQVLGEVTLQATNPLASAKVVYT